MSGTDVASVFRRYLPAVIAVALFVAIAMKAPSRSPEVVQFRPPGQADAGSSTSTSTPPTTAAP